MQVVDEEIEAARLDTALVPSKEDLNSLTRRESFPSDFKRLYRAKDNCSTSTVMRAYGTLLASNRENDNQLRFSFMVWRQVRNVEHVGEELRARIEQQRLPPGWVATFLTGEETFKLCGLRPVSVHPLFGAGHLPRWALAGNAVCPMLLFEALASRSIGLTPGVAAELSDVSSSDEDNKSPCRGSAS